MALHSGGGTSLADALRLTPGQARAFFETKAFKDSRKAAEAKAKMQAAVVNRLNGVIGVLCQLPKALR